MLLIKKKEDIFYLTGEEVSSGFLLLSDKGGMRFFGDGLESVQSVPSFEYKDLQRFLNKTKLLEVDDTFYLQEYNWIKKYNEKIEIVPTKSPLSKERIIKSDSEIVKLKKAYAITLDVFDLVKKFIITLPSEKDVANFIKIEGLKRGVEVSFSPIVASGLNSAIPHHHVTSKKIKRNEPITLDFGFKYQGYVSDFTRTIFIGNASSKLASMYGSVLNAYKASFEQAKLGMKGSELDAVARNSLKKDNLDNYFIHSLGHGSGLEVHESPSVGPYSSDILASYMVFSIEPGVYIKKVGGVRIEDLVYFKKDKLSYFSYVSTTLSDNIINA